MLNEADTCREFVVPKLHAVGWDAEPHRISEQVTFTDGRVIVGSSGKGRKIIEIMERVMGLLEKGKA